MRTAVKTPTTTPPREQDKGKVIAKILISREERKRSKNMLELEETVHLAGKTNKNLRLIQKHQRQATGKKHLGYK